MYKNNYKYGINAIKGFLMTHNDDEGLRTFFLNAFSVCKVKADNRNKLFWVDKNTYYKVDFLFAKDDSEKDFWISYIKDYSYLYVYASLSSWNEEFKNEKILKRRCEEYQEKFSKEIKGNIEQILLKGDRSIIPSGMIKLAISLRIKTSAVY